jgi:hypothetical protein
MRYFIGRIQLLALDKVEKERMGENREEVESWRVE